MREKNDLVATTETTRDGEEHPRSRGGILWATKRTGRRCLNISSNFLEEVWVGISEEKKKARVEKKNVFFCGATFPTSCSILARHGMKGGEAAGGRRGAGGKVLLFLLSAFGLLLRVVLLVLDLCLALGICLLHGGL